MVWLITGAWCWYDNANSSETPYGKLYNWYAVETGKLCPTGWHVPSDTEWTTLTDFLGGTSIAGGKMKATGTTYWSAPNAGATNESGFTGLPGGYRNSSGSFSEIINGGSWWSSTQADSSNAWYRNLGYRSDNVARDIAVNKQYGFSVRCVRD